MEERNARWFEPQVSSDPQRDQLRETRRHGATQVVERPPFTRRPTGPLKPIGIGEKLLTYPILALSKEYGNGS